MEWPFKAEVFTGNWVDAELVNDLLVLDPDCLERAKRP